MQPLDTFELWLNVFVAVVMPLLIITNLIGWSRGAVQNAYLWREHSGFMWASMVVIGLLSIWSFVRLGAHFGLISGAAAETALPIVGIPFLAAAVVEMYLGSRVVVQYLRRRGRAA